MINLQGLYRGLCQLLSLMLIPLLLEPFTATRLAAAELEYSKQEFSIPADVEILIVADTNGDKLKDLITVAGHSLRIYFQNEEGFNFESGFDQIEFPGQAIGWDISSAYSESNSASIIALIDGKEVRVWHIDNQKIQQAAVVKSGLNGFLSKGVNRLYFSRDINGDGHADLIIPGAGELKIHISNGTGGYQPGLSVRSETRLRTELNPNQLERQTGQSIRIPMMELRDVNGDGLDDLVSRTDEALNVFIANDSTDRYFPAVANYTLDIGEIERRIGEFDIDNLDFSNLTGLLALTHEEILEDVDGDAIDDLLLREGGKISLYMGTSDGMNFSEARQILRSGGNVLGIFLYDENEDGLKDLWLWRVEPISVGDIFVWLALSGSISIEAFIYPNDGERFSRRPTRKLTVKLKFPSALRLFTTFRELTREAENLHPAITSTAHLDSNLDRKDLMILINNQLQIFLNSIEAEDESVSILGALEYSRDRDDYEINIRKLIDNISINANPLLDSIEGKTADLIIDLESEVIIGDIIPVNLNDDSLDDVILFTNHDSSHIQGILLISK